MGRATGRADDSVKAFKKAQTLAPNDVGVQTRLASARMGAGEPDAAMGDLEHTLQLAPTEPQVAEALFFAALATGDQHPLLTVVALVRTIASASAPPSIDSPEAKSPFER